MSLIIRNPGILTTVQDLGRFGSRKFGINPNGPMDPAAVRMINIALRNDENSAVLEMHYPAAEIEFTEDTTICIGGGDFTAQIEETLVDNWAVLTARKSQILKFRDKVSGNRAYLGVQGGLRCNSWLGSASTNLIAHVGGQNGRAIAANDIIDCNRSAHEDNIKIGRSLIQHYSRFPTLRIIPSLEFDMLTLASTASLQSEMFTLLKESNRMGFRLQGAPLILQQPIELVSSAANFGTVQLLPDGQMIVLMADHQTAGGYPRLANIISADLPVAGQLGPGDRISFQLISIAEAETAYAKFERDLHFLKIGCRLRHSN
jgi:antagonist of KipI